MLVKSNFIPSEIFDSFFQFDELLKNKPITLFNDYIPTPEEITINPYNFIILNEPNELFGIHDWVIENNHIFDCILTWSEDILNKCPQTILFPFGMSSMWETPELYHNINVNDKHLKVFFVCGVKNQIEGHKFRHKIYNQENKINIPHKWILSCPIEEKNINFNDSMFHIAIENTKQPNLFTEKIIDAFLTKTIPIYRGCNNIGDFFDKNGIIEFNNEEELINIVNSLTEKDYWDRKEAIEYNYQMAEYWKDYYMRLIYILKEIIKINNI